MYKSYSFLLCAVWLLLLAGCSDSLPGSQSFYSEKASIVGWEQINGRKVATLWRNNKAIHLSDPKTCQASEANDVAASGDVVYVAGYETKNGSDCAKCWKIAGDLITEIAINASENAVIKSIAIGDYGNIFMVGTKLVGDGSDRKEKACLWIDGGKFKELPCAYNSESCANSISISRRFICIVGSETVNGVEKGKLWINSEDHSDKYSGSICYTSVDSLPDDKFFLAGVPDVALQEKDSGRLKYWHDGKAISLSSAGQANAIYAFGDDVYVAGCDALGRAAYWQGGRCITLPSTGSSPIAKDIMVFNKNAHVVGHDRNRALYWKNGELQSIVNENENNAGKSGANAIYVR